MRYSFSCQSVATDQTPEAVLQSNRSNNSRNRWYDRYSYDAMSLTKDGKPWLPVMGEIHFSRVPERYWLREIRRMRQAGIDIIASYVFWIHHEEEEGHFSFAGNLNLRRFVELCTHEGLLFFLRPGPWAHGECRNGGLPDWLIRKCGEQIRTNDPDYLEACRLYFRQLAHHLAGLESNIIGIQLDNELGDRPEHLAKLKAIMLAEGLDAPYFTATGWGGPDGSATLPADVLPMFGNYPEAPWTQHTRPLPPGKGFFFSRQRNDAVIGNDLNAIRTSHKEGLSEDVQAATPFLTCELGGGIQVTYHRRPLLNPMDMLSLSVVKIGSGCNLPGYYMFHGGQNPLGKKHTMQESRISDYPNDYPVLSYDFQSCIGDSGQIRAHHYLYSCWHRFLHNWEQELARMPAYLPDRQPADVYDTKTARLAVRSDHEKGFLFINTHQHGAAMSDQSNLSVQVRLTQAVFDLDIPYVPAGVAFCIPFGWQLGRTYLRYALAQPEKRKGNTWYFRAIPGVKPIIAVDDQLLVLTEKITVGDAVFILLHDSESEKTTAYPLDCQLAGITSVNKLTPPQETMWQQYPPQATIRQWQTRVPLDATLLKIDYTGNIAQAWVNHTLVADHFWYGDAWFIDCTEYRGENIQFYISDLPDEADIYFEVPATKKANLLSASYFTADDVYV